ncbi:hypothetical protein BDZ97DRAFT_88006 [Flammula alnicola]|nr:hypothetical protein BDZ97DRAFT_88006 [Flammula alnicola]
MFSSFLPNASSSLKLAQNGPSKPSNRFSVRVFKTQANAPFPYPINAKVDPVYRPALQREQQNSNWYPASNAYPPYDPRPRATTNYAIYPSATNDTFIYEQSSCSKSDIFSNSELDSASTATFSPAMSTDSTITLPSTTAGERSVDDLRLMRPSTPAPRSGYAAHGIAAPQAPVMGRTASSGHHMHEAQTESLEDRRSRLANLQSRSATPMRVPMSSTTKVETLMQQPLAGVYINHLPEYAASTISELEVEERDRIAKLNAGYNSTPTASFYTSSSGSSNDVERRRMPTTPQNLANPARDSFTRVASSQPLHPNLHFPIRPQESDHTQSVFQHNNSTIPALFPAPMDGSPPRVERIPSQLPPESQIPQAGTKPAYPHTSIPGDSWSRDATFDSEHTRSLSYRTSPKSVPSHSMETSHPLHVQPMPRTRHLLS